MYHRVRKKMLHIFSAILVVSFPLSLSKYVPPTPAPDDGDLNNNIIDFDDEYTMKFNKRYPMVPWHANDFDKNSLRYTIDTDINKIDKTDDAVGNNKSETYDTTTEDYRVIPLELLSTTVDPVLSLVESTNDDLTVIPLPTTEKAVSTIDKVLVTIDETIKLPSTENDVLEFDFTTKYYQEDTSLDTTTETNVDYESTMVEGLNVTSNLEFKINDTDINDKSLYKIKSEDAKTTNTTADPISSTIRLETIEINKRNKTNTRKNKQLKQKITTPAPILKTKTDFDSREEDVPIFTELDTEIIEDIPEDYYDSKDSLPTAAPKTDAISVLFGLAGSVVESVVETVAEKVVPKTLYDLFKRMQRQSEALEAERLRSREENGGLGQFGRGILKSISSGLAKPLGQLMDPKANGSLDTDRGFVAGVASGVASGVTNVANVASSVVDAFKDKVQAIYPGTVWCGDGRSAQARSGDLGLFFFTDTCCRQHDACKIYIPAGETRYGLTNTGLFTRSHCSCDAQFRECLRRTNSLVSAQIGLTYFNVLGPQCLRRAHPILRCTRKTRLTGLKCEEYELDYTKPKMWQWFDNETF